MRYFRILFSTGKLNIKENREQKKMRSFALKDLYKVLQDGDDDDDVVDFMSDEGIARATRDNSNKKMLTYQELKKSPYMLDEIAHESSWKHGFVLFFTERSFLLKARTKFEYN